MLQAFFEFALIGIAIQPSMHSVALGLAEFPFSFIGVSTMASPHTRAMFEAVHPLSIVILSIWPSITPDAIRLPVLILPFIETLVREFLCPIAFLLVVEPLSFVDSLIFIDHDPQTMLLTVVQLAIVRRFLVLLVFQIGRLLQFVQREHIIEFSIGFQETNCSFLQLLRCLAEIEVGNRLIFDRKLSKFVLLRNVFILSVIIHHAYGLIVAHYIITEPSYHKDRVRYPCRKYVYWDRILGDWNIFILEIVMNCPKIPDLNLFRGKRQARLSPITKIQQKGLKLLKTSNNRQLVEDLQAELYLDNYRTNLKHFISPTKYKEQAEKYLKENKITDQIYLKALRLPRERKFCPNCFDQYVKVSKPCYCELEHKVPPVYRYQSSSPVPKQPLLVKKQNQYIQKVRPVYIPVETPRVQTKQHEINSRDFILTESQAHEASQSIQSHEHSVKQSHRSIVHSFSNRVIPDGSAFLRQMRNREDYLDNINMDVRQSRVQIDFQGLAEAKRQYVHKSNQILDRLNGIIQKFQK